MKLTPMLTLLRDYQLPSNGAMQLPCWGQFRRVVCMSFVFSFYFNGVTVYFILSIVLVRANARAILARSLVYCLSCIKINCIV